jgi:Meiotically Up-regulated Gene 113 (MUG113) protein
MWWSWRKRYLDVMEQQTAAIERMCTMQLTVMQHMQHLLMLQDVMPQKLIVPDAFTHPLFHAFDEIDVSTVSKCSGDEKAGHVYLLVAENGWSKIGMSRNIKVRIKQLKIQFPFQAKLVHAIPTDDVVWAEKELHDVFEDCRLVPRRPVKFEGYQGKSFESTYGTISALGTEWFRLSAQAVLWIRTIPHLNHPGRVEDSYQVQWNETVISSPNDAIPDAEDYRLAHRGNANGGKRRRIELLEEYDVDKFWCQFVEPTQKPPKEEKSQTPSQHVPHRFSGIWKDHITTNEEGSPIKP